MGYETNLLIGKEGFHTTEFKRGPWTITLHESGEPEVWKPREKDHGGNYIPTGRNEIFFSVYATVDLCKCGQESAIHRLDRVNKDASKVWYWYENPNQQSKEDCYGDELRPVPISQVLAALEEDCEREDYRRLRWARDLLRSMVGDEEGLQVLVAGH